MIVEFGHFALILALLVAIVQMIIPALGAQFGDARLMRVAEPAAVSQLFLLAISFLALTVAYVVSDFSVVNVASNSHSTKPMIYKISGVWGNHEGSMLLWVLILALFGGFDPIFFMYGEEADLCLRARGFSARPLVTPAATIIHYGGHPRQRALIRWCVCSRPWQHSSIAIGRA